MISDADWPVAKVRICPCWETLTVGSYLLIGMQHSLAVLKRCRLLPSAYFSTSSLGTCAGLCCREQRRGLVLVRYSARPSRRLEAIGSTLPASQSLGTLPGCSTRCSTRRPDAPPSRARFPLASTPIGCCSCSAAACSARNAADGHVCEEAFPSDESAASRACARSAGRPHWGKNADLTERRAPGSGGGGWLKRGSASGGPLAAHALI